VTAVKGSHPVASLIEESYALERAGDIGAALQKAGQALDKALDAAEAEAIATAQVCVAFCELRLGHYDRARTVAEEALSHAGPQARPRADALRILGDCAHEAGDLVTAETFYQQAIDLGRQLGSPYVLHRCLHSLSACVYIPRGQFELALAADEESLRLARDLDMREEIWLPLVTMGWVYRVTGQYEQALAVAEEMHKAVQPGSLAEGYYCCLSADLAQDGQDPRPVHRRGSGRSRPRRGAAPGTEPLPPHFSVGVGGAEEQRLRCPGLGRRCAGHRQPGRLP
jgi:tetratricopeptide (TPR) repeat protein